VAAATAAAVDTITALGEGVLGRLSESSSSSTRESPVAGSDRRRRRDRRGIGFVAVMQDPAAEAASSSSSDEEPGSLPLPLLTGVPRPSPPRHLLLLL
jgi:hypothetical protein